MLNLPIGCMKKPFFSIALLHACSSAILSSLSRCLSPQNSSPSAVSLLTKLFETKTKRHKERIIEKVHRKQETGNLLRPHLLFSGSSVTKKSVVQESLLQFLFLSQKSKIFPNHSTPALLAGKYIMPAHPSF